MEKRGILREISPLACMFSAGGPVGFHLFDFLDTFGFVDKVSACARLPKKEEI
jgi:hypothetical protein